MARIALEEASIPTVVMNAGISTFLPYHTIAFGGVRVLVPPTDAQCAREVLEGGEAGDGEAPCVWSSSLRRVFVWLVRLVLCAQVLGWLYSLALVGLTESSAFGAMILTVVAVVGSVLLVSASRRAR